MKKRVVASLAAAMVIGVAGTAFAAANPFVDVPAKHWAYDAVTKLSQAGIVDGYGDGKYQGDKVISRYEMAQIVAKAMAKSDKADAKQKAAIDKLAAEFADELNKMGVRVSALEDKVGNIKFGVNARVRYQENMSLTGTSSGTSNGAAHAATADAGRFQERVRFMATATIDDNWTFNGRFGEQNTTNRGGGWMANGALKTNLTTGVAAQANTGDNGSDTGVFMFDKMEFAWKNQSLYGTIGRSYYFMGQGIMMDAGAFDGATLGTVAGKFNTRITYGDLSQMKKYYALYTSNVKSQVEKVLISESKYAFDPSFTMTLDYLNSVNKTLYPFKQTAVGFNKTFTSAGINVVGEYVNNAAALNGAQNAGWYTQVTFNPINAAKPGSFDYGFNYYKLGANSIDGDITTLNVFDSSHGFKGYGLFVDYVFAKNAVLNVWYQDGKPYDQSVDKYNYNKAYGASAVFTF